MSKAQAMNKLMVVIGLLLFLLISIHSQAAPLHHQMKVELHPGLKMIKAQEVLTFPKDSRRKLSFLLHKDLHIASTSPDDTLTLLHPATADEPYAEYGLQLGKQDNKVTLSFYGTIFDPIVKDESNGLISPEGATLFGSTYWYPYFLDMQTSFDITVTTPPDWQSLVQGQVVSTQVSQKFRKTRFVEIYPQEDIYLIAGPFKTYSLDLADGKKIQVLLRKDEPALAQNFLSVMPQFIQHYSSEIAPYPYSTFTVVENMWETGYGMPSFTLLGPTVLRLPFILNSSLPHEILHNWWGNSVYVDYEKGNWSEGLTTYMADYWQQEKAGQDRKYRMEALMNFADLVANNPQKDFPLRQFKGRHNSSSQAVGYGKSMMFFQMLEKRFGKELFKKALQQFYTDNLYKKASFSELQTSFEKVTTQNLESFFSQWLDRKGAPQLQLLDVKVLKWADGSYNTTYTLHQAQQDEVYELNVPIQWQLESGEEVQQTARLSEKNQIFSLTTRSKPVRISVDPDFHVFRQLYPEERPTTLSAIFGASQVHFYHDGMTAGALSFAQKWVESIEGTSSYHRIENSLDIALQGAIVLIGENPIFSNFMAEQLVDQEFQISGDSLRLQNQEFKMTETSTVVVARLKNNPEQSVVWVRWSKDNNPVEWAARLTHYGTFGILVFNGRPAVFKSTWPTTSSPLQRRL